MKREPKRFHFPAVMGRARNGHLVASPQEPWPTARQGFRSPSEPIVAMTICFAGGDLVKVDRPSGTRIALRPEQRIIANSRVFRKQRVTLTAVHDMVISVVIPAFNEASYLPATLSSLRDAISVCCCGVELIVVDNESSDRTGEVARSFDATVVREAIHNIARVRNAGASAARGDVLAFVDADTIVPPNFLEKVAAAMSNPACFGGSADIIHTPASKLLRAYLKGVALVRNPARHGPGRSAILPAVGF